MFTGKQKHDISHPMTSHFVATRPDEYPLEMLKQIHLQADPHAIAAKYGFDYDILLEQPLYITQSKLVENSLMLDGTLTPIIAGFGLHTAVEKLAYRVQDDRMTTSDLVKAIETLKKVKDGNKINELGGANQGVSLVINIPAYGTTPKQVIEVTATVPELVNTDIDVHEADFEMEDTE